MGRGRQFLAEGVDKRSGLQRRTAGEWRVHCYLKSQAEDGLLGQVVAKALELAVNDLREAECFHKMVTEVWGCNQWRPEAYDADLFTLVLLFYLSARLRNNETEFLACASSANMREDALRCLVDFSLSFTSCDFDDSSDASAIATLNKLWTQRSSNVAEGEDLNKMLQQIMGSTYFLSPPKRNDDGPACATSLSFIREKIKQMEHDPDVLERLETLERDISRLYDEEAIPFEACDWEDYYKRSLIVYLGYPEYEIHDGPVDELVGELEPPGWGPLTSRQVKAFVNAVQEGSALFQALVFHKPPKSVFLSHLLAVYQCTTHARLWLQRCPLAPYAAFGRVTYDKLGRQGVDEQALESPLGFCERVPSFIESLQKQAAILAYDACGSEGVGLVFSLQSPSCERVLVPCHIKSGTDVWMLDDRHHWLVLWFDSTLWYERKAEVFVDAEDKRRQYYADNLNFLSAFESFRKLFESQPELA